ncbi:MAG TPA: hypothetical protein ENK06_01645 [Gammaproteobacteria bacterium]|nr:hypothetical protein [Gammaproteobacteria bacterium]
MLYLFTDFGWQGPYVGQMKSKVSEQVRYCQPIDLMHDVPAFNVKAGSYLLAAVSRYLPPDCVVAAIVDPQVGSDQRALVLRADYRWFVGPDNGLFDVVAQHASSCHWYEITFRPAHVSRSFHGRDIFIPVAGKLLLEESCDSFLSPISCPEPRFNDADLNEIIYIDQFGNLMTGLRASEVDGLVSIHFAGQLLSRATTFSDVDTGTAFFYENSQGLIEIAVNCGNAQAHFSATIGDSIALVF